MIRKHIRAFHSAKRFQCSECEKAFTGADKLKAHMVKHSDIKEFECDECGKQFKRKDKLKEHAKRMHSTNVSQIDQPMHERREFGTMSNKRLINDMYPINGTRSKKNKKKLKGKQSQKVTETAAQVLPGWADRPPPMPARQCHHSCRSPCPKRGNQPWTPWQLGCHMPLG